MTVLLLPAERLVRWCRNFSERHGSTHVTVEQGALVLQAADGSHATVRLPFDASYDGDAEPGAFAQAARPPETWGVLLVRKGGFAVARMAGPLPEATKVGSRHVQGRTKAGGQSQQRFARRRAHQARTAYEAAAEHAARVLVGAGSEPGGARLRAPVSALVAGGDRAAVEAVLADPRLAALGALRTSRWLAVPEPRRAVLDQAIVDALALSVDVHNAG